MDMSYIATPLGGLILATLAGLSIPVGAFLARLDHVLPRWLETELCHTIVAFGGGALFSAIALVLLPEAIERLPALPMLGCIAAGALVSGRPDVARSPGSALVWPGTLRR